MGNGHMGRPTWASAWGGLGGNRSRQQAAAGPLQLRVARVSTTSQHRRGPPARRYRGPVTGWWQHNWVAVCGILLMVACEYKWRIRDVQSSLGGQLDLTTFLEIGVFAAVSVYVLERKAPALHWNRTAAPMGWAAAYTGFLSLSVGWSPYKGVAAVRAVETCVVLLFAWVVMRRGSRAHLHRLAHGFMVVTALSVGLGVAHPMPQLPTQLGRFTWLMVHPTSSAMFLGISIVLGVAYLVEWAGDTAGVHWRKSVYLLILIVNVCALIGNHTRGAILGVLVALLVLILLMRPIRRRLTGLALAVWLSTLVVLTAADAVVTYVVRGDTEAKLASLNDRTNLWSVAFDAWQQQPLFGYGLNASRGIFVDSTGLGTGHNAEVNVLVDLGAVGLLVWAALVVSLTLYALRLNQTAPSDVSVDRTLVLTVLSFLVVDGVFAAGFGGVSNVAFIWLFLLVAWALLARSAPPTVQWASMGTDERSLLQ